MRLSMGYRVRVDRGGNGRNDATIHAATGRDLRCRPWEIESTDGGWFGPFEHLSGARRLALSMGVPRRNVRLCKICLADVNTMPLDSIGAGAAGAVAGAGVGLKVGGLEAAGMAIVGSVVSIPAVAVVAVPAIVGCGCALGLWEAGKFVTKRLREH